jgi:ATP-binding cassette subfamily B protein
VADLRRSGGAFERVPPDSSASRTPSEASGAASDRKGTASDRRGAASEPEGAGDGSTGASDAAAHGVKAPIVAVRTIFANFWPYARPYRRMIGLALLLGLLLPVLQGATIWMFKVLTDRVLVPKDLAAFLPVAGIYALITVVVGFVMFSNSYLSRWLSENFSLDLRTDVFAHLHSLSIDVLDSRRLGDILSRLTSDVAAVRRLIVTGVTRTLSNAARLVLFAGALFWLDWRLALVGMLVAPTFVLAARFFSKRIKTASREAQHRNGTMTSVAEESLGNAPLVQAYQQQDTEVGQFHAQGSRKRSARLRAGKLSAAFGPTIQLLELVGVLLVIGLGTWRMLSGALTLGGLLAFIGFLTQLYSPVRSLSRLINTVYSASAGAERIIELQTMSTSVPDTGASTLEATGRLRFDSVSFTYREGTPPAVDDVSFQAHPGEILAFEGPSGSGKTTIAKLVNRLYDPTSGQVLIDDVDIRELTLDCLRSNVSLLLQETLIFHGSVYDNIAYGRPDARPDEIFAAARAAEVDEFVSGLNDGYDSMVGERGRSLSGGQRQRIAIARALVRDAPIIVLDEPATGLDEGTADQVMSALNRVMAGRTTLIIAHDRRSLAMADRVLSLRDGRLQPEQAPVRWGASEHKGAGVDEVRVVDGVSILHKDIEARRGERSRTRGDDRPSLKAPGGPPR